MTARLGTAARIAQGLLVDGVRNGLAAHTNPAKAPQMQAYMKSTMPYRGVPAPALRAICREAFAAPRLATVAAWRATVLELWRHAARLSPLSQREALQNVHASHAAQTR